MRLVPDFEYPASGEDTEVLALTLSQREWEPHTDVRGGSRESATGVRASFTIHRARMLDVIIRVYEHERAAVEAFVEWAQDNPTTAFAFRPDKLDELAIDALLTAPVQGEEIRFTPTELGGVYEFRMTLRKADGTAWNLAYWGDTDG